MALKYSRLKIFHFPEKLNSLSKENSSIQAPLQIRIKPTNVCTHGCWYCAYKAENLQLGKDMIVKDHIPREKMLEIVDDIIEMGVKSVTFSGGGDPFHYKYLRETIEKLSTSDVKFASLTHGARLEGDVARIFKKHGSWIRISIDGWDKKSYSEYRNVSEKEFTRVIQNIQNFKKLEGDCVLGIVIVIDQKNAPYIYDMVELFQSLGVQNIKLSPCIVSNNSNETNSYHLPIYDDVRRTIKKIKNDFENEEFEVFDAYHKIDDRYDKDYEWCPYLQICPVIAADQNIYTCHDKAYNLDNGILGSLKEQRLKEFWFSDKNNFFKTNPKVDCSHHCAVNRANEMITEFLDIDKEHLDFV